MALRRSRTSARIGRPFKDARRDNVSPVRRVADTHFALQAVRLRPQHPGIGEDTSDELGLMTGADFVPPDFRQNPPLAFRAAALAIASTARHRPRVGVVNWREPRFAVLFEKQPNRLNRLPGLGRFCATAKLYPSLERPSRRIAGRARAPRCNSVLNGEFAGRRNQPEPVRRTFDLPIGHFGDCRCHELVNEAAHFITGYAFRN